MVGYFLLGVGVVIMIFSAIQIVFVFTGKATPVKIFQNAPNFDSQVDQNTIQESNPEEMLRQFQKDPLSMLGSKNAALPSLIDTKILSQMLNLMAYYFIMQFLMGFGFKLASLGVNMLRPIKVNIEDKKIESALNQKVSTI